MYDFRPRGGWFRGAWLLLALSVLVVPARAQAVDKYAAEFLKIGVGARALGMGGAFVSLADDASAAWWNPAGLVQIENREAMAMHASQFGGVLAHNFGSLVLPLQSGDRRTTLGVTAIWLSVDDIRVTRDAKIGEDGDGNPILDESRIRSDSAYDLGLLLSYARELSDSWSAGVNFKLVRQSLVDEGSSFGVGADLGFLFRPNPGLAFGLRLADITTTRLYWDSGRRETVAPTLALGVSGTRPIRALQGSLTLGLDLGLSFDGQPDDQFGSSEVTGNLLAGAEYWFRDTVALRAGSDSGAITAGAGVRYRQFGVDYAFLDHEELDSTHRVSALYRF